MGIATGLISNPVVAYSLYTLKTTGAGLPPGPGGLYGAIGECRNKLQHPPFLHSWEISCKAAAL